MVACRQSADNSMQESKDVVLRRSSDAGNYQSHPSNIWSPPGTHSVVLRAMWG